MSQLLLIDLPATQEAAVDWLLWDSEARRAISQGSVDGLDKLAELQADSHQYPCYVIVPGECVSHFRVTLPSSGAAAQAALPYKIEEQLCGELETQHIAHDKIVANRPITVAVVARELMALWQEALQRADLRVRALLPDYLLLPDDCVLLDDGRAVLSCGDCRATIDRDNLPTWWSLASRGEARAAAQLLTVGELDSADGLPPGAQPQPVASRLEGLAALMQRPALNLLQGAFKLRDPANENWQLLRWPAIAAVAVLLLHWAALGLQTANYQREQAVLDAAIEQVYRDTFPEARKVVNPRSQMRSRLRDMEQGGASGPLLSWLERSVAALKGRAGVSVTQMQFQSDPQSLRLSINAPDYATVDQISQSLTAAKLQVERGAFSQQGNAIYGQIVIKGEQP